MKSKGFAPLILLIVVAALGVAGYIAYQKGLFQKQPSYSSVSVSPSPTADPTANWQIYRDEENGIEFKYPPTWYSQAWPDATFQVFLENEPLNIVGGTEILTSISVGFNEVGNTETGKKFFTEKTLEEGINRIKDLFDPNSLKVEKPFTVGGKEAVQISGVIGPGMLEGEYFKYTLVQLDKKLLMVTLHGEGSEKIYGQILSTFKFLSLAGEIEELSKCVPTTESGNPKCYSQTTKEACLKFTSECRWAIALP